MNAEEGLNAFESVRSNIRKWRRVLYVGCRPETLGIWGGAFFMEYIRGKARREVVFTIVELEPQHCRDIEVSDAAKRYKIDVICADITKLDFDDDHYDACIWWHGPEHVPKSKAFKVINNMKSWTKPGGAIILGAPLGKDENICEGEVHHWEVHASDFIDLDLEVIIEDRTWKKHPVPHITGVFNE